jgi:hypothetical protein
MPIACTRCGAKEDGEILTAPISFAFKHDPGCGHGVGPLVVIKGQIKKTAEIHAEKQAEEIIKEAEASLKLDKDPKVSTQTATPKKEKNKTFSQKD